MVSFPKKTRGVKRGNEEMETTPSSTSEQGTTSKKAKGSRLFDFSCHPKRKIALKFLYFGWEFDGLVQQLNTDKTVEKYLMDALLKTRLIDNWKNCDFSRCGRTDKGVSAYKQVAALIVRSSDPNGDFVYWDDNAESEVKVNYKSTDELPYVRMLNGVLPSSIRITAWAPVSKDFSARHGCNKRIYKYSMPRASLNIEKMQRGCHYLVGEHDFRNFCQIDANEARVLATYIRRIFNAQVEVVSSNSGPYDLIELTVEGSGFLWHMIRYIASVLHEIGQGNEEPEIISLMLDVTKTPRRPQYSLAVETPLCLFDCKYDAHNLNWQKDETAHGKTVSILQSTWAAFATKAKLLKNMIEDLQQTCNTDVNKGLLQFTQDRPLPAKYIPFAERPVCDSLEEKLEKLKRKQKVANTE